MLTIFGCGFEPAFAYGFKNIHLLSRLHAPLLSRLLTPTICTPWYKGKRSILILNPVKFCPGTMVIGVALPYPGSVSKNYSTRAIFGCGVIPVFG